MLDGISFHLGFCPAKSRYNFWNTSGFNAACNWSRTSFNVGQMSFRYTGPLVPCPIGSLFKSMSTRGPPARTPSLTSGGDIKKFALIFLMHARFGNSRLPESTDAATKSFFTTASSIGPASGPEFPMHVVQP